MSTICQEFVQNAWKKDLCSNCFKARGEHSQMSVCDALLPEIGSPTKDVIACSPPHHQSPKKSNDYITCKRQSIGNGVTVSLSPQHRANSRDGLNVERSPPRDNNRLNEVSQADPKSGSHSINYINNNNDAVTGLRSSPRRIGSNGVHLWEIGQPAPKDDAGKGEKRIGNLSQSSRIEEDGSHNETDDDSYKPSADTNGSKEDDSDKFELGASATNGSSTRADDVTVNGSAEAKSILKEKPAEALDRRRRSSVLFVEESQVIGYGGNDYNWEDQESSEEPSDVDSLENYDASEEERALTDLTTVNTQFNSDNTNLLLHQARQNAAAAAAKIASNSRRHMSTDSSTTVTDSRGFHNSSNGGGGGSGSTMSTSAVSQSNAIKMTTPSNYYSTHINNKSFLHANTGGCQQLAKSESNSWNAAQSFIRSNLFDGDGTNGLHGYLQQNGDSENEYADSATAANGDPTTLTTTNGRSHRHGDDDNDGDEECSSDNEEGHASAAVIESDNKWQRRQINCQSDRSAAKQAGSSSVPLKRSSLSSTRTSVHQLFNEAPVTAAEIKTATDRLPTLVFRPMSEMALVSPPGGGSLNEQNRVKQGHSPIRCNGGEDFGGDGCSPYGVVSISQLPVSGSRGYRDYSASVPEVPLSPPPASDDESQKTPIHPKHQKTSDNLSSPTNGFGGGFTTKSPTSINGSSPSHHNHKDESGHPRSPGGGGSTTFQQQQQQQHGFPNDGDRSMRNREYATVNYSCHYASSYVPTGMSPPPEVTSCRMPPSPITTLPPTPLTNPYSSTEILKGIPTSPPLSPTGGSPNKPLVTKPKPKLPVKPIVKLKSPEKHESLNGKRFEIESPDSSSRELLTGNETTCPATSMDTIGRTVHRSSAYYQEIEPDYSDNEQLSEKEVRTPNRIYQSRNSGVQPDSSKIKTPKRLAPRPPGSTNGDSAPNGRQPDRSPTNTPSKTITTNRSSDAETSPTKSVGGYTPSHEPTSSLSKSQSGSTSGLSVTSYNTLDHHHQETVNNSSGPDSYTSSPYRTFSSLTTSGSYTLSQNPPLSKSSSSSSSINGSEYYSFKETPTKSKKSKFSLKKLLKFARDDHGDGSKTKGKWSLHGSSSGSGVAYERKTKLEIIHPFDLIQNAPTDNGNLSPSISETSAKCSTFKSAPSDSIQNRQLKSDLRESQVQQPQPPSPDSTTAPVMTEGSSGGNGEPANFRSRPPPPPRNRGHADDAAPKDKVGRPTPTAAKQQQHHAPNERSAGTNDNESEQVNGSVVHRENGSRHSAPQHGDNRSSYYSSSMEYANLGDIRNSVAPKKPERCASTSAMDLIAHDACKSLNVSNSSDSDRSNIVHSEKIAYNNGVTYYAPPEDNSWRSHPNSDIEEMYVERSTTVSDQSQPSSFTSDSLSTNSSLSNRRPPSSAANFQKQNGRFDTGENGNATACLRESSPDGPPKVSDGRSVPAPLRGSSEPIYAKSANSSVPPEPASPSITLNETEESGSDAGAFVWPRKKASRLSLRKTKTVVHKNLEDNYGAVVTANHQTLSQILEQVSVTQQETTSKVGLLKDVPLHWSDFTILEESKVIIDGQKAFYSAIWQHNLEVTLLVSQEPLCSTAQTIRNSCVCVPLAEFEDAIPINLFSKGAPGTTTRGDLCRGTVWVMERMRVETVAGIGQALTRQTENDSEAYEREACFILLQIINGLKHLQMLGIEEVDDNTSDFILTMKNSDVNYRLVILPKASSQADGHRGSTYALAQEKLSLCQGALILMLRLLKVDQPLENVKAGAILDGAKTVTPNLVTFKLFAEILVQERATSLSQVKTLLENMLWGPTDLDGTTTSTGKFGTDQDQVYQRWLDLERSMTLNNLIRTQSLWQIRLTVYEEYMLSFLVRTCAKTLREAAAQLQTATKAK